MNDSLTIEVASKAASVALDERELNRALIAHLVYNTAYIFSHAEEDGDSLSVSVDGVESVFYVSNVETSIGGPKMVVLHESAADMTQDGDVRVIVIDSGFPKQWSIRQKYYTITGRGDARVSDFE